MIEKLLQKREETFSDDVLAVVDVRNGDHASENFTGR